jgi:hypothetical protein
MASLLNPNKCKNKFQIVGVRRSEVFPARDEYNVQEKALRLSEMAEPARGALHLCEKNMKNLQTAL